MIENHKTITISVRSIALLVLLPLALWFLWVIRDIFFSLLIGFILMSALRPGVVKIERLGLHRTAAVAVIYIAFIVVVLSLFSIIIPPILFESAGLIGNLPTILEKVSPQIAANFDFQNLATYAPDVTSNVLTFITGLFSNALFVVTTIFFGLYLLLDDSFIDKLIRKYVSKSHAESNIVAIKKARSRMSAWFWGEVTLMSVVGAMTFVGLNIIGIKYAIPLAVLAGLLEIVPNIGPTISAIPAIIIGLSTSLFTGFSALALCIIIQQLENSLIVPMVMKKAVGINPIITLLCLLIGGRVGGVLGVLLAIPLFLFIETVAGELFHKSWVAEIERE